MSWVKANFTGQDVTYDAIGQNFKNWIGGSALNNVGIRGGGFVMMSFASGVSASGWVVLGASDFIFSTFGATIASNLLGGGAGFKVVPIAIFDMSGDGISSPVYYHLSATAALAGDDSLVVVIVKKASQTIGSGVMYTLASNISVHFQAMGWIVSIPTHFS